MSRSFKHRIYGNGPAVNDITDMKIYCSQANYIKCAYCITMTKQVLTDEDKCCTWKCITRDMCNVITRLCMQEKPHPWTICYITHQVLTKLEGYVNVNKLITLIHQYHYHCNIIFTLEIIKGRRWYFIFIFKDYLTLWKNVKSCSIIFSFWILYNFLWYCWSVYRMVN